MPGDLPVDSGDKSNDLVQFMIVQSLNNRGGDLDMALGCQGFNVAQDRLHRGNTDIAAMKFIIESD